MVHRSCEGTTCIPGKCFFRQAEANPGQTTNKIKHKSQQCLDFYVCVFHTLSIIFRFFYLNDSDVWDTYSTNKCTQCTTYVHVLSFILWLGIFGRHESMNGRIDRLIEMRLAVNLSTAGAGLEIARPTCSMRLSHLDFTTRPVFCRELVCIREHVMAASRKQFVGRSSSGVKLPHVLGAGSHSVQIFGEMWTRSTEANDVWWCLMRACLTHLGFPMFSCFGADTFKYKILVHQSKCIWSLDIWNGLCQGHQTSLWNHCFKQCSCFFSERHAHYLHSAHVQMFFAN